MNEANQMIDQIAHHLERGPYHVERDVTLPDRLKVDVVASRTYFTWKGLGVLSQHVIVRHVDRATRADAKSILESGFRYAKQKNRVPLMRGLQFGYLIVPVLVGDSPAPELVEAASNPPDKHFALMEYPVIVESQTSRVTSFRGTSLWNAFYFPELRKVVDDYIQPALSNRPLHPTVSGGR